MLLNVENLKVYFKTRGAPVRAVDGASFRVERNETLAMVGESGCGKSVSALSLAGLVPAPGYMAGGSIVFDGRDIAGMRAGELRKIRGSRIAYVFQEPATSLNPVFKVGRQVAEAIRPHAGRAAARARTAELMRMVGFSDPARQSVAYPHQFSGGMQQRAMIAMALACRPDLLVADEPTTALDVTIQAQILELLARLQAELSMAILLITHNLGLAAGIARRICVMYAGRVVESGPAQAVLRAPAHPYTRGLLSVVPRLDWNGARLEGITGSVPDPARLPQGCKFHPRCRFAKDACREQEPVEETFEGERSVKCHYWKQIA